MITERYEAEVQYNDLLGAAAADWRDSFNLTERLAERGSLLDGETVVALDIYSGEVHNEVQDQPVKVCVYVARADSLEGFWQQRANGEAGLLRRLDYSVSLAELFGLFKRFSIRLSDKGILDGETIQFKEEFD